MNRFFSWYCGLSPRLIRAFYFFVGGFAWSLFASKVLHLEFGQILVVALVAGVIANKLEGSEG